MPGTSQLQIETIPGTFSICQVEDYGAINIDQPFIFTGRTDKEKSLVCPAGLVPENTIKRDDGWKALRIRGTLDFSLTGILAGIADVLAEAKIGIFAISTYDTDYVLVKEEKLEEARKALRENGYQ